ncbi:MAG: ATP-binding cassette domain-containing protein [Bacteroidetes bacterium]|nr:ATP-binding cassette domain-containing protein [Bacteroidota bacterium]
MSQHFLELQDVTVKFAGTIALDDISFRVNNNEQWAIVGSSGSGKTVLAHTILGKHFHTGYINYFFDGGQIHQHIAIVEQQHRFKNLSNTSDLYYQQRFNSSDAENTITVKEELKEYVSEKELYEAKWADELHIRKLFAKPLIQLSNGENKRVQLAIALLTNPGLLIFDNPFLGLDADGRKLLHRIIDMLSEKGIHILLITSPQEIPSSITHVAELKNGKIIFSGEKKNFHQSFMNKDIHLLDAAILSKLKQQDDFSFEYAVKMKNVSIAYGENKILNNINWQVAKGEKWSVSGPNGAGKSTLLSLISADNPQAYANEIYLFDKRRGTGESIWDIKQKIGFISPELHVYFDYGATCFEVIASGLFDTIGLFRHVTTVQEEKIVLWMKLLRIENLRTKRLAQLSGGQQRMVLLARALIKNPPLLILDEPSQGLDDEQTFYFKNLVDQLCQAFDTTLIYVSHYAEQVPSCVTKFLRLENGSVK